MRTLIALALCLAAAGCTKEPVAPPTVKLTKPSADLMVPPLPLEEVSPGESLYAANVQCRAQYGATATQLRGLQSWAAVVTRAR